MLITGGAGFVGSHLALLFRADREHLRIIALDNLKRRGSEYNIARLRAAGVEFVHGDIRAREDLLSLPRVDLLLECSAEPSVLAGVHEAPDYVINTNLFGTVNCLELARRDGADVIFLSTSRVYPIRTINGLGVRETATRFELEDEQRVPGASSRGLTEAFPLDGPRSLYGATKLASELLLLEYIDTYRLRGVVNRCGVLTGPWQMGKVDQGVVAFWLANHVYGKPLAYFGYGGRGLQVRDILHVRDLYALITLQLERMEEVTGRVYNIGGGREVSLSLRELTEHCRRITGVSLEVQSVPEERALDIRVYLTDHAMATRELGWQPRLGVVQILEEMHGWLVDNRRMLEPILGGGSVLPRARAGGGGTAGRPRSPGRSHGHRGGDGVGRPCRRRIRAFPCRAGAENGVACPRSVPPSAGRAGTVRGRQQAHSHQLGSSGDTLLGSVGRRGGSSVCPLPRRTTGGGGAVRGA